MSTTIDPDAMRGKVALVTGAAAGIGRASAVAFAAAGATVVASDITADGGEETARMIRDAGGDAAFIAADVAQSAAVAALIQATVARYGRLDYAHNNAGIEGHYGSFLDYPDETFDRVLAINLKGVWLCMKQEIPQMLRQGSGAIVNTASIAGLRGSATLSAYSASKHAVIGITKSVAQEFGKSGVRINAICPGVIDTDMVERAFAPPVQAALIARTPLGRLGTPEEIAQAVVWLCSDAAAFVTGAAFVADGGLTA